MKSKALMICCLAALGALSACDAGDSGEQQSHSSAAARIESALIADPHDVAGFFYQIECEDGFSYSEYVALEEEMLPPWLDPDAGDSHYFSDLFTVLPEGECKVCATPMQDQTTPSAECGQVCSGFEVMAGQTTEIVLMSQCEGDPSGAGDIVAGLNDPPVIVDVNLNKFICLGEKLEVTVHAEDPNGDTITYNFQVVTWPEMPAPGTWQLFPSGNSFVFVAGTEGMYEVIATVTDPYGASTSITFPIHVSECGVCCYIGGETPDAFQIVSTPEECERLPGKLTELEDCDDVCCWIEKWGAGIVGPRGLCEQNFPQTQIVDDAKCDDFICCKSEQGFDLVTGTECYFDLHGSVADMDFCRQGEDVCCDLGDGLQVVVPAQECKDGGYSVIPMEKCPKEVCCKTEVGMVWTAVDQCPIGRVAPASSCKKVAIEPMPSKSL